MSNSSLDKHPIFPNLPDISTFKIPESYLVFPHNDPPGVQTPSGLAKTGDYTSLVKAAKSLYEATALLAKGRLKDLLDKYKPQIDEIRTFEEWDSFSKILSEDTSERSSDKSVALALIAAELGFTVKLETVELDKDSLFYGEFTTARFFITSPDKVTIRVHSLTLPRGWTIADYYFDGDNKVMEKIKSFDSQAGLVKIEAVPNE